MQIFPLKEGSYSVDATKKFIPFDPNINKVSERPGSLFIHVNPFLVKTDNDLILFDAGLGFKNNQDKLVVHQNIRNAGFEPDDVTLVLMSHLHYDHSGGLVVERNGKWEPSFPDAEHVVQRSEWEFAFQGKSSSYHQSIFEVLQRSANFTFTEGDGELKAGISYQLSGGHCPFHQVFLLEENGEKVFFGGDELPEPEQLLRKFIAKYDYDGRKAMELREIYGKVAAAENRTCLFYHAKKNPVGRVEYENETFRVIPV
ncbi:glyoxylase-like metal-dependent hydrolase (beta-lactamase superfamily II) [Mucilaginibacter gracilis]|uniref:Glyoxylase-like metal-dependent hydrolase (Beta-lactamase superfamily II) n=1 Tax=Mucilaginibacter gracilis TaxID=423350 RepID=A0A495J9A9_9SPHI|nr:MBL fold metallo-hydrolase [Mucilaginibacter gracilis]RKR85373.1 glyoxylase-like metal-dependent hydrolase (beta-lactamase superfamily II) [Mucilaginibacter gracilis]